MPHEDEKMCILGLSGAEGKGRDDEVGIARREGETCHMTAGARRISKKVVHDCGGHLAGRK